LPEQQKEIFMQAKTIILMTIGTLALGACAKKQQEVVAAPPPPQGSIAGSTAADRDGDGMVDGYYTADGIYHPNVAPAPPPPPLPMPTRKGERG
jgi:hypothetical protein